MHVRHDLLRCVGRRGGPEVGHQIQQGPIVLMPDGGNQGSVGRRRGAHHVLIGKANQIFESAAATRHDDHIHIWIGIQLPDGRYHVRRALLALHVHMRHLEADDGPTQTHVGDDVAFRTCLRRADQADAMRKFRQRLLAIGVEQTFSLKLLAQLVDHGLQTAARAGRDDRVAAQRQRRALHPHVRLAVDDDTVALHKRRRRRGEPSEAVDFHSDVLLVVAQRDVGASLTTRVDLRDLPGHPYGGPTFDRRVELLAEQAHRPWVVGGGFRRQTGQRLRRPLRRRWVVIRVPSHKSRFHHLADKWNICSSVANAPCVKIVRCVGLCQNDTPR